MTVFAAPINVANAALLKMGAKPLASLTATTAEARIINGNYELIVKDALTKHAWNWAKKRQLLVSSGTTADVGKYIFELPADLLNLRYVTYKDRVVDVYESDEGKIILPYDAEVYAHYTWRVPEAQWPADFAKAIVTYLHALLKGSLVTDDNASMALEQEADKLLRRAMVRDKRQTRGREINETPRMARIWYGTRNHGPQA